LLTTFTFVVCSYVVASARQGQDGATIDTFIARQARRERGEEYREARKVVVGDLTYDGVPETVVLYTIEGQGGTNLHIQYLAVFARQKGKLSLVTHAHVAGKSVRSVELRSVEDDAILLETMSYAPEDAQCCPSVKGRTRYVLTGRRLREQKRTRRQVGTTSGPSLRTRCAAGPARCTVATKPAQPRQFGQ
jgi:hypothetical protein